MSKNKLISSLLKKLETNKKSDNINIDQLTDYIVNNTCTQLVVQNNKSQSPISDNSNIDNKIKQIVEDVFRTFFSYEQMEKNLRTLKGNTDNINDYQRELSDEYNANIQFFEDVTKKILDIYFGKKNEKTTVEECQQVHSIFNLTRLYSLLLLDGKKNIHSISFLKSIKEEMKQKFKDIVNAKLILVLNNFITNNFNIPMSGGGFFSKLKDFGRKALKIFSFPFLILIETALLGIVIASLLSAAFSMGIYLLTFSLVDVVDDFINLSEYSVNGIKKIFKKWNNITV